MASGSSASEIIDLQKSFGPVEAPERMILLDVLRGFAILGILFANNNLPAYTEFLIPYKVDQVFADIIEILVREKFWPLFAILFGIGFAIQLERAIAKQKNIIVPYLRRLSALALTGAILQFIIEVPQLLHLAIAGVMMLFIGYALRKKSKNKLLWCIVLLFMIIVIVKEIYSLDRIRSTEKRPAPTEQQAAAAVEQWRTRAEKQASGNEGWNLGRLGSRAKWTMDTYKSLPADIVLARGLHLQLLLFMLIGIFIWRAGILQDVQRWRYILLWILAICLPTGLGAAVISTMIGHKTTIISINQGIFPSHFSVMIQSPMLLIGSLGMALSYISVISLLMQYRIRIPLQYCFAPVGRMALTNYILQALLPAIVFGYYTPALFQKLYMPAYEFVMLLIIIFGIQIWLSRIWLKNCRFGPLEWILRSVTYWKQQPMRNQRT
jgi:uncharacterized protein